MLTRDVALADGSVLKFEGGQINGKGTIKGNRIMIDAPRYRIFGDNVKISGIANGEVSAHWWGAVGDGIAYDCGAIKRALRDARLSCSAVPRSCVATAHCHIAESVQPLN